jgi:hypothetical protein
MIVGNPAQFAIESHIERAYREPGKRALGYFLLHVDGVAFGVRAPEASLLANSYDEVVRRLEQRGEHLAPNFSRATATEVCQAFIDGYLAGKAGELEAAIELAAFERNALWAPDGDEAFDDGSYVFQFDVADKVRVIGCKNVEHCAADVREAWIESRVFYDLLGHWIAQFDHKWKALLPHH